MCGGEWKIFLFPEVTFWSVILCLSDTTRIFAFTFFRGMSRRCFAIAFLPNQRPAVPHSRTQASENPLQTTIGAHLWMQSWCFLETVSRKQGRQTGADSRAAWVSWPSDPNFTEIASIVRQKAICGDFWGKTPAYHSPWVRANRAEWPSSRSRFFLSQNKNRENFG